MGLFYLFLLVLIILLIPTVYAGLIGAPWAPTFTPAIKRAFKRINLNDQDLMIDLGAGDGKVMLEANKRSARAIGYELSPIMWFVALIRLFGKSKSKMYIRNFFHQKLPADTTVIFIFLMPDKMQNVYNYLAKQDLPKLRHVLVYSFPFPNLKAIEEIKEPNCGRIFIYDAQAFKSGLDQSS